MSNDVIITGASSGIGAATAQRFLETGARVLNLSRRACPIEDVTHVTCDLASAAADEIIEQTVLPWRRADAPLVLIHNAARLDKDTVETTSPDALRAVLDINVIAVQRLNQHLVHTMPPGSSVLYVGSTLSEKAVGGAFTYVTSKHALLGMMRATCQDLAGRGVHTVCVCPGFTDTDMLREHVPGDVLPALGAMSAFGRLVTPDEIAQSLLWCSQSAVLNGAVVHANLGQIES
ncbi:MAG: SDR family oxidoreductase [Pseudomonadota bacterium]